jgi:hypothetical protein
MLDLAADSWLDLKDAYGAARRVPVLISDAARFLDSWIG